MTKEDKSREFLLTDLSDYKVLGEGHHSHGDHKNGDEEVNGLARSPAWQQLGAAGTSDVTGPEDWQA